MSGEDVRAELVPKLLCVFVYQHSPNLYSQMRQLLDALTPAFSRPRADDDASHGAADGAAPAVVRLLLLLRCCRYAAARRRERG